MNVKKNHNLCIILKENKAISLEQIKISKELFRHDNHVYFTQTTGAYMNSKKGYVAFVFLEGISLPVSHKYIKYETVERKFKNETTGRQEKHKIRIIKGLKFDSRAISIILNQKLAEMFTRIPMDMPNFLLAILLILNCVFGVINIGMWFL